MDSTELQPVAVKPRVKSNLPGVPVLLLDTILELAESDTDAVRLVGEGKSMAIRYLSRHLSDHHRIQLMDDESEPAHPAHYDLAVFTAPVHKPDPKEVELVLALWSRDDCIEYLMSTAPQRCKSVMSRLIEADDLWLASGSPRVLGACLDIMIEDDSINSMATAIAAHFSALPFKRPRHRKRVIAKCLKHFFESKLVHKDLSRFAPRLISNHAVKILTNLTVRYVVATDALIDELGAGRTPLWFSRHWSPIWIQYLANQLANRDQRNQQLAIEHLDRLANSAECAFSSNAASLLSRLDSNWQPTRNSRLHLENAQLPGFKATELTLEDTLLSNSDFSDCLLYTSPSPRDRG